jgi:hypothetical protein
MVIDNLDMSWAGGTFRPFEANPPLIVDANAVLAFSISSQHFKTVAGQHGEISQLNGRFQTIQLQARSTFDARERLHAFASRKIRCPLVPIADNHRLEYLCSTRYVKHNIWGLASSVVSLW